MGKKPTYSELEQRIRKLERLATTYSQAKESLKKTLEKQPELEETSSAPDMALEVLDQDIKGQKAVEQAFIAEHILRKKIEKSVPCGIAAMDLDGCQTYVNNLFCRMLGWQEKELIGTPLPLAVPIKNRANRFPESFQKQFNDSAWGQSAELQFLCKNGEQLWGLVQTTQLYDSEGNQVGLLMSVVDITRQKKAEERLRALSSRLIDAQESERKHLSIEIHDSIGGKLAGIKYSLEKTLYDIHHDNKSLEHSLQEILAIVHGTIEEAQRITKNLHPSIIYDLGLLSAMKSFCREFQDIYSDISVNLNFDFKENQLAESIKILIYRVMQEAFNNVAKHSGADRIDLAIEQKADRVIVSIYDNGKGFDLETVIEDDKLQGIGLKSMSERTELFGGKLHLKSKPGCGTLVRASWSYQGI